MGSNRPRDFCHRYLAVNGVSLPDGAVIANGFPDDLCKAICEIFVIQQFADVGPRARGCRS